MRNFKSIAFSLVLTLFTVSCFANQTARVFMARKGNHIAFFLPVFHTSTQLERDQYLESIIEPIFAESTILYAERAHPAHIYPFAMLPCERHIALTKVVQLKLDHEYRKVKRFDSYRFPMISELKEYDFAKIMVTMLGPVNVKSRKIPPRFLANEEPIIKILAKKYDKKTESIETMQDFRTSYCELKNTDEKSTEIDSILKFIESPVNWKLFNESSQYSYHLKNILLSINSSENMYSKINKRIMFGERFLLSNRNEIWLKKIKDNAEGEGVLFYALGAAHFLDNKYSDGLFKLMQRSGFEISVIHKLEDLPNGLLKNKQEVKNSQQ